MSNDNNIQISINIKNNNLEIKSTATVFINGNKAFVLYWKLINIKFIVYRECSSTSQTQKIIRKEKLNMLNVFGYLQ